MKIYYDNKADDATITSDEAQANYPAANMQNSILPKVFKGAEYTELQIDAGGGLKDISRAYTNLIQDPTDLTTANWTEVNGCTATITTDSIDGNIFTKLSTDGTANPSIQQGSLTLTNGVVSTGTIILRNGNLESAENSDVFVLADSGTPATIARANVVWGTKTVTAIDGSVKAVWYDDITVQLYLTSIATNQTAHTYRIDPDNGTTAGKYIYTTAVQLIDGSNTYFPFYNGAKAADIISETYTMPDRFTFDVIVTPFFLYSVATANKPFFVWRIDSTNRLLCFYEETGDQIRMFWQNGGTGATMNSQQFDAGTSYVNINQKIRIVGSMDLKSGGQNDSRFIVVPLESGALAEDTSWSVAPDVKTSDFPTLSIGQEASSNQIDASYQYLRIYEGLLVGTVASSSDIDDLLDDKELLLDKTYQSKITATDLLLANTTIHDGDTILLRANDVDSYNAGSPVDETVVWDEDIIHHNFTSGTYQYWWLSVNSSNDVEIGRLYLGESSTPPDIAPTVSVVNNTADVKTKSIGGQTYGDERYNYKQFITTFSSVTHAQKAALETFFDSITTIKPYFIEFDETELDLTRYYVTTDQTELRFTLLVNSDYYTASVNFVEEK